MENTFPCHSRAGYKVVLSFPALNHSCTPGFSPISPIRSMGCSLPLSSKHCCSFQPAAAHGQFSPDFPTLSAPMTRTFASIFRAAGPGTSMRAGWSGVKLVLRRKGSRSPMPSVAEPLARSQPCVQLGSAQPTAQRFPRHPGDPRGPYPSPQPQGRCTGNCRQPDEKLCHGSECPEHTSVAEPALPAPSAAGGREAPAVGTSCSPSRIPGGTHAPTPKRFVPRQGHAAPCPFPTVIVGMSPGSAGVSPLPGCLVRDEEADKSPV